MLRTPYICYAMHLHVQVSLAPPNYTCGNITCPFALQPVHHRDRQQGQEEQSCKGRDVHSDGDRKGIKVREKRKGSSEQGEKSSCSVIS